MKNQQYCAFLRGINIGGKSMKMEEVKKVFQNCGMQDVTPVLATGNIIYKTEISPQEQKDVLEKSLSEYFQYEAFLFVRSEEEVRELALGNPFAKDENFHVYAFVTSQGEERNLLQIFNTGEKFEGESAECVAENFYWRIRKGNSLDSSFGKILGRKDLKSKITSRNINTVDKIVKKF